MAHFALFKTYIVEGLVFEACPSPGYRFLHHAKERTKLKCELYNENFQNFKSYNIPKAQLIIADIPYNIGKNFYGSNPS